MTANKDKTELLERAAKRGRASRRTRDKPDGSGKKEAEAARPVHERDKRTMKLYVEDEKTGELRESGREYEIVASFGFGNQNSHDRNAPNDILPEATDTILEARQTKAIIELKRTNEKPSGTIAERLAKLDEYVQKNPNQSLSESVQQLFPELMDLQQAQQNSLALPKEAPALWANDKQPNETPPDFIKRHYEPWLGKGLTRPGLKHLDPGLYRALYNWLQRGNTLPADLDIPTLEEANDRWAASIRHGEAALPANPNELQRAAALLRRREADQDDGKSAPRKK